MTGEALPPVPRDRGTRELLPDHVQVYLARLGVLNLPPVFESLHAEASRRAFPIVGPEVGRLLMQLAAIHRPARILELGSGFGYSAIWWALGHPDAEIHCTEYRREHIELGERFVREAGLKRPPVWHEGEALASAAAIPGPWDVVFLDIDKQEYPRACGWAGTVLRPGGLLIFDNALRNGAVALPDAERDAGASAVVAATRALYEDPRYVCSLLPIRDGVLVALRVA